MMLVPTPENLDEAIRQNRTAAVELTVVHRDRPLAGLEVQVAQKRHRFLLGSTWGEGTIALANEDLPDEEREVTERRNQNYLNIFNFVTLPFYWARFEPVRGQTQTERIRNTAEWYRAQGCMVKGHPLCWHTLAPDWLLPMSNAEILAAQKARIRRDVGDFAGLIDLWDVVNEAVIMPVFERYDNGLTRLCKEMGRIELIRTMFDTARETNPNVTLLLNDFDVSDAYDILVEGCLAAGVQIDTIGIQTHMHQGYWGPARTLEVISHFERFDLPIHFTENNIVSGRIMPPEIVDLNDYQVDDWPSTPEGEERQAREVVQHFKTLMAHPAVQAATWWDFTDGGWLNAPAGLLRADGTPKPAYNALEGLIKGEWWLPPTRMTTDENGRLSFTGFLGDYAVTLEDKTAAFSIDEPGEARVTVRL